MGKELKKIKNGDKFLKIYNTLKDINTGQSNLLEVFSIQVAEHLSDSIKTQELEGPARWPKLSKDYARRKWLHDLDERTLIRTGAFVNSIAPIRVTSKSARIGINDKGVRDYMIYNELGGKIMPRRSVFNEYIKWQRSELYNKLKKIILKKMQS